MPHINAPDFPQAACIGTDPNLWHPVGLSTPHTDPRRHSTARDHYLGAAAIAICRTCPHCTECADWAERHNEWGIWGATTPIERNQQRRRQRKESA
jgi:hypothetical protein